MAKYKVFAADGLSKEGVEILEASGLFEVKVNSKTPREELLAEIPGYDALIIRSASTADKDVIEKGKNLKLIARAGVGLDNVDIPTATESGIVVMNAPGGNTLSTSELSFAMLLSLARNIPQAHRSMCEKRWDKKKYKGTEIHGKTLGVIGLGRIGREVSKRALAFGMRVYGYDPYFSEEQAKGIGISKVELQTLYKESDFITIHTPLTKDTENMITKKEMQMMKRSVRLINCARGGIINEEDLRDALQEGIVAGAALDVYTKEPVENYLYADIDTCVTTPHLGASTSEAQVSVAIETANGVLSYFRDNIPQNSVNYPTVDKQTYEEIKGYLSLSSKLGYLLAQVAQKRITAVKVSYSGIVAARNTKMITTAAVKGVLSGMGDEEGINFVNTPIIAKEKGIEIVERTLTKTGDFSDIVAVKIETEGNSFEVWGTIFQDDNSQRIVRYNIYHLELKPEGIKLFIQHRDRPGFIGAVGTLMGQNSVNIADMRLIRESVDQPVLTVLTLDSEPPKSALDEIMKLDDIYSIRQFVL